MYKMPLLSLCQKDKKARFEFINHVYFLVSDGYFSFSSLCEADKSETIGLFLKALDACCKWDCIIESSNSDVFFHELTNSLMNPSEESKRNLFDVIQRNAIDYYEDRLNDFFAEHHEKIEWENFADDSNYRVSRDPESIYGTDFRR